MKKMIVVLFVAMMSLPVLAAAQSAGQGPGPGGGGGPGRFGPPQEAYTACDGKVEKDACTVTFNGSSISGTCEKAPQSEKLACRPEGKPPAPPSGGSR